MKKAAATAVAKRSSKVAPARAGSKAAKPANGGAAKAKAKAKAKPPSKLEQKRAAAAEKKRKAEEAAAAKAAAEAEAARIAALPVREGQVLIRYKFVAPRAASARAANRAAGAGAPSPLHPL